MATVEFTIPGRPATKGSVRFTRGNYAKPDNPRLESWTAVAKFEAREAMHGQRPTQEPVYVQADFYYSRPKCHYRTKGGLRDDAQAFPMGRADVDKCLRALLDAMIGTVVVDDGQVVQVVANKRWTEEADRTMVRVEMV